MLNGINMLGIWPESKSFSDDGYGPIPSKWKGICQNDKDAGFHCNRSVFFLTPPLIPLPWFTFFKHDAVDFVVLP